MTEDDYSVPERRFSDTVDSYQTVILDKDMIVFGKALRAGTVLRIIGRREFREVHYFVVNKDTWESLLPVNDIHHLIRQ